jgi:hypothetical protein
MHPDCDSHLGRNSPDGGSNERHSLYFLGSWQQPRPRRVLRSPEGKQLRALMALQLFALTFIRTLLCRRRLSHLTTASLMLVRVASELGDK